MVTPQDDIFEAMRKQIAKTGPITGKPTVERDENGVVWLLVDGKPKAMMSEESYAALLEMDE